MADKQKAPDTVRGRKKGTAAATQRFLPVAEIRNDTLLLKNGGLRAVLEVEAMNFNLKSETEQQGIIAGYGAFVNTLNFPVQIVIRSSRTNIDDYLESIRAIGEKHSNQLLKNQTLGYVGFMQKLLEVADIMQKRFYIVIPVDHSARKKTVVEQFFDWLHPDDTSAKAGQRYREFGQGAREIQERIDLVSTGLSNIGLHTRRLNTRDLIDLLYKIFNPKTSQVQKLPKEVEKMDLETTTL